jgi:hypothetical protein
MGTRFHVLHWFSRVPRKSYLFHLDCRVGHTPAKNVVVVWVVCQQKLLRCVRLRDAAHVATTYPVMTRGSKVHNAFSKIVVIRRAGRDQSVKPVHLLDFCAPDWSLPAF